MENRRNIVVIGASAGGLGCLRQLLGGLSKDIPASLFIVQHVGKQSPKWLQHELDQAGPLPVSVGNDKEEFLSGHVYIAAPDCHLLLRGNRIAITHGPRENRSRPAIDPLFRSAAVHHGARVIGVILSGMLDDGTAGLLAVKQCGGIAVVQDPADALYRDMPESAAAYVEIDYQVQMQDMAQLLTQLTSEPCGPAVAIPKELILEDRMAQAESGDIPRTEEIGQLSGFSCPECSGPLWQINGATIERYRCHTGHAFTAWGLMHDLEEATERALWVALQTLEGRRRLLRRLADQERQSGHSYSRDSFNSQADELEEHITRIRQLLMDRPPIPSHSTG